MTAQLPRPGSIWRQTKLNRNMRVIFSAEDEIVVHDAEMADRIKDIISWVGTPEQFEELFEPGDESKFPKSAKVQ